MERVLLNDQAIIVVRYVGNVICGQLNKLHVVTKECWETYVAFFIVSNKTYCADFIEMICLQYRPYCGKLRLSKLESIFF